MCYYKRNNPFINHLKTLKMNTKHIEALIEKAIEEGRINAKDREKWMKATKTHAFEIRAALAKGGNPDKALVDVITGNAQLLKF